jgi:ribosomal protein S1
MEPKPNSIVRGEVVRVTRKVAWIDVGFKRRTAVPLQEFYDEALDKIVPPRPGAVIAVYIESLDEETGALALSYRKAKWHRAPGEALAWRRVTEGHVKPGDVVTATVCYKRGGGLKVVFGFRVGSSHYQQEAGLPTSELQWPEYADEYVGHTIPCEVLEIDRVLGTVIVSERRLIERGVGSADEGARRIPAAPDASDDRPTGV